MHVHARVCLTWSRHSASIARAKLKKLHICAPVPVNTGTLNLVKKTSTQDREAWSAERKIMQSTMELAEERFVEEKNTLKRVHEEEKDTLTRMHEEEKHSLTRAHQEQTDRWQIELSEVKQGFDTELKSMKVHAEARML